ncbi:MAG: 16S rRNA processing protein RimM [Bacteroidetes bacterium]|nr:16S rRNA processing protein RimM [Bacteroidota bacterium]MBS1540465.1 16S rRNA processing protein RimM [Bacteroidota bacterium]
MSAFFVGMNINEYFKIGYISKTHGLKGEVTAVFESTIDLAGLTSVFLSAAGSLVPYFITSLSDRGDKSFIKFDSVNTVEQAAELKGCGIYLAKISRPKLKRGQFYEDELIGFEVEDENLGQLGKVTDIEGAGENKFLLVAGNQKEILIPVHSPFIKSTHKTQKIIKVNLPDGYLTI